MFYNLLKLSAIIALGRFLKPRIKGLPVLILCWFIIRFLHAEYISYVELSGNAEYLIQASLLKIGLYVIAFLIYVLIVERRILLRTQEEIEAAKKKSFPDDRDDGFDFLRHNQKLKDQSDQLLNKE